MRERDRRWDVTIWQPERPSGTQAQASTSPVDRYYAAEDYALNRKEYDLFGAMSLGLGLRDRPICERAVVINGRLVTVRERSSGAD